MKSEKHILQKGVTRPMCQIFSRENGGNSIKVDGRGRSWLERSSP